MNINHRWISLGFGIIILAGCGSVSRSTSPTASAPATPVAPTNSPTMSPTGSVSCSDASRDASLQALRELESYTYEGEGYVQAYEEFTGGHGPADEPERIVRRPTKFSGAYVAPDRQTEERHVVTRDDVVEARRTVGDDVWFRFVGSRRWQPMDVTPARGSPILAIVDQAMSWTTEEKDVMQGLCRHVGTSASGPWTVTVTVPVGSHLPTTVELTQRFEDPPDWGQAILQVDIYTIQPDAQVTIEPPVVETGPATEAEVLYHLERRGLCLEPPCDVSGFELVYQAHNGAVDLFGYELPSGNGYVWFDNGLATESGSSQVCPSEWDFSFHSQWLGGRLMAPETATLHVRLRDGQESEHAIIAPAYIVPVGIAFELELESFWIVGPDGDELFRYDAPSPETGVPPPPPPSPGC